MNIFDQYGIKEVADVTLYSIHKKQDGSGDVYYVPALYLDTLKISTAEKTAENVWAQGGLGNARLICWDYGKQINVSLEDALCTPASLGLCWGGVLSSDWKDGHIDHQYGISYNGRKPVERISRIEKSFYPRNDRENALVGRLIPSIVNYDYDEEINTEIPIKSSIVDGTKIDGFGYVRNKPYKWIMKIESGAKAVGQIPLKIFDWAGKSYKVDPSTIICHKYTLNDAIKHCLIYRINPTTQDTNTYNEQIIISETEKLNDSVTETTNDIATAKYLKIMVDNENNYTAYTTTQDITGPHSNMIDNGNWNWKINTSVNTDQFRQLDMCIEFNSINELIYFLITKYEDNIYDINIKNIDYSTEFKLGMTDNTGEPISDIKYNGRLWAYVNPKTMLPYEDEYWFHQGEPYYKKSLTLADKDNGKKLKSQKITVTAEQFPGMYMMVGETYIRSRDTGEDERMQIKFPLCKVKSDQTLTLQADGDPTVFNMELEVARPINGIMMELTEYEVADRLKYNEKEGFFEQIDGSTEILSE